MRARSAWTYGWLMTLIPNSQTGQIRTPWSSQSATSISIRDLQASKTNDVGLFDRSVGFRVLFRYAPNILPRTSEDIAVVAGLFLYIVPHPHHTVMQRESAKGRSNATETAWGVKANGRSSTFNRIWQGHWVKILFPMCLLDLDSQGHHSHEILNVNVQYFIH